MDGSGRAGWRGRRSSLSQGLGACAHRVGTGRCRAWLLAAVLIAAMGAAPADAQLIQDSSRIQQLRGVGIEERLGERVPAELELVSSDGTVFTVGELLEGRAGLGVAGGGKPVVLVLAYFRCPVVCPTLIRQLVEDLRKIDFTVGEDFTALVVSFDPTEGTEAAAREKQWILESYVAGGRELTRSMADGWVVATEREGSAAALADAVGFGYRLMPSGEYSHPMSLVFLTPDGRVARYIQGLTMPERDRQIRFSLLEAAEGRLTRTLGDLAASYCWVYDPNSGAYTMQAFRVMQIGGVLSMVGVFGLIGSLLVLERRRRDRTRREVAAATEAGAGGAGGFGGQSGGRSSGRGGLGHAVQ